MEAHQQILIDPRPKISPEFVGLSFFLLLSVREATRKSHAVERTTRKSEDNHRVFHGDAKFVEANLQPLPTFSVSGQFGLT
jgi:hypothetical protein